MRITKLEIIEEINEMLGDCLSIRTEQRLQKLAYRELFQMRDEIKRSTILLKTDEFEEE